MKKRVLLWFFNLLLIGLFAGCSGGGGSNNDIPDAGSEHPATSVNRGIAVDPYIFGAIFEEVSSDGTRILQNSTASDLNGRFTFANPVQDGSTIRIKISSRGTHGNAPFTGMLKRKIYTGDAEEAVVSPLTTLLANGMGENELISLLANAGLSGLEPEDLTHDPMQGLSDTTGSINNDRLRGLQANMAVNALLQSIDNFDYAGGELDQVNFADFVQLSQETLNPDNFARSANFVEFANAVIDAQRTVISQIRQELAGGSNQISAEHFGQLRSAAMEQMTAHFDSGTPVVDPPTDPGTTPAAFAAADFFASSCTGCHSLTGNSTMNLSGDGAKLDSKFGNGASHKGNALTTGEISDLAAYLNASTPVVAPPVDPGAPPAAFVAADFFGSNCAVCHSLGTGSGIMDLAGDSARLSSKFASGASHNGNTLTANEISDLAAYLNASTPVVAPPVDPGAPPAAFVAADFFGSNCAVCHSLGTGSGIMDLAGDSARLSGKFTSGASHNGNTLSSDEISYMASFLDSNAASEPPPLPVTGSELYASECQGCHGNLATSNISNRSFGGIADAIAANIGGMGALILTDAQLALIADSLPAVIPPTTPIADRTGIEVYDQECSGCHILGSHDTTGNIDLASRGAALTTKIQGGHMGKSLNANELATLADFTNTFGVAPPPVTARTPESIYGDICSSCHMLSGLDPTGSIDLAGKGSTAVTKVASGHGANLSNTELTSLAAWFDTFSPPAPPAIARSGETIYTQSCAACHKLYGFDTLGNIDLASMGNTAITKLATGHGTSLSAEEKQNIAAWLDTWTPAPPPLVDRNGETVYNENCAVCHKLYAYDAAGNVDLAGQGNLAVTKLATGHGGNLTGGEVTNLTNWLDTFSPAPPPTVARAGQTIYDTECTGCHKVNGYDATGTAPDIAGNGSGATIKLNSGHNGINLLAEELVNLGSWLNTFQAGDPYAGSCTACHGQPPQMGAHEVHSSLADIGTNCAVCHETAAHNGSIDLALQATWNAKSGPATSNGDTCSNISCHGGQTTPNWMAGSLDSSTQCKSCHERGTNQYNAYNSGRHKKHVVDEGFDCLVCHDASKLGSGHFSGLSSIAFEQNPATTLKNYVNYSGGSCTLSCHGEDHRDEKWIK